MPEDNERDRHHNGHKVVGKIRSSRLTTQDLPVTLVLSLCGQMSHNTAQKNFALPPLNSSTAVHGGIHNAKAQTHLARMWYVIPHPRVST